MLYVGVLARDGSLKGMMLIILNASLFKISNDQAASALASRHLDAGGRPTPYSTGDNVDFQAFVG